VGNGSTSPNNIKAAIGVLGGRVSGFFVLEDDGRPVIVRTQCDVRGERGFDRGEATEERATTGHEHRPLEL
jgi:hypothetical protein